MPLTIQRSATVYRLWDENDLRECFGVHAETGWVCSLVCAKENDTVVWAVRLQHSESRQLISAAVDDVVVSDGVTVQALTVAAYNTANPDNVIEEGS